MTKLELNALQRLCTEVVEKVTPFGLIIGGVNWNAGCSAGDLSFPKGRTLESLTEKEIIDTLDYCTEYISELKR